MFTNLTRHMHALGIAAMTASRQRGDDRGQSTAEYALLILAAATIALLVVTWATSTGKIGELFDAAIDSVIGRI